MTRRSSGPVDANSRIVVTGGAVGLSLALVGSMAWANGSTSVAEVIPVQGSVPPDDAGHRIVVIVPATSIERADLPPMATPAPQSTTQQPVSRSQGS